MVKMASVKVSQIKNFGKRKRVEKCKKCGKDISAFRHYPKWSEERFYRRLHLCENCYFNNVRKHFLVIDALKTFCIIQEPRHGKFLFTPEAYMLIVQALNLGFSVEQISNRIALLLFQGTLEEFELCLDFIENLIERGIFK